MSEPTYCAKHPETSTNLRCGRCEQPVCPRCMVHSPVGVRCAECGQSRRLPTFQVTTFFLARAIVAGLLLGISGGTAVAFFSLLHRIIMLDLIAIVGVGYVIGEGISAAVNRKRGRSLKFVAGGSMLIAYTIISIFSVATLSLLGLLAGATALYIAVNRF